MTRTQKLEAVRHYAPPLIVAEQLDRRGARLKSVSPRAVAYAKRAGFGLREVYPADTSRLRELAPASGTPDAVLYAWQLGLTPDEADDVFGAEPTPPPTGWCWKCIVVGFAIGAVVAGPMGAAAGALLGAAR